MPDVVQIPITPAPVPPGWDRIEPGPEQGVPPALQIPARPVHATRVVRDELTQKQTDAQIARLDIALVDLREGLASGDKDLMRSGTQHLAIALASLKSIRRVENIMQGIEQ